MQKLSLQMGMNENSLNTMFSTYSMLTREVYNFSTLYNVMDYLGLKPDEALRDEKLIE